MTNTDRISEIRARCEAATPGPWEWETNRHPNCNGTPWGWIEGPAGNMCWSGDKSRTDAIFIAHARTDIPYLLDRLAEAEAELARLREAQRWIPVTERLPRQNTNVITFTPKMAMPIIVDWYNGYYGEDDNEWYEGWNTGRNITHWMPLPDPPEDTP